MKLTDNELNELKYHYVDRVVDNMATKDLVQYVFDDMLRYVENQSDVELLSNFFLFFKVALNNLVSDWCSSIDRLICGIISFLDYINSAI